MSYPAPHILQYDDWFDDPPPRPEEEVAAAFDWEDTAPSEYEPPDPPEEEITMHEKMYRIATAYHNPFAVGGSENCHNDLECNIGGSENASRN